MRNKIIFWIGVIACIFFVFAFFGTMLSYVHGRPETDIWSLVLVGLLLFVAFAATRSARGRIKANRQGRLKERGKKSAERQGSKKADTRTTGKNKAAQKESE